MKIDSDSGDDPAAASNPLATYLQSKTEFEKQKLSRQLHDELGGLLVASLMDAAWVEQHLSGQPDEVMKKLQRVIHSIGAAIAMKRQIVEDLRPTLLDNVGLYAALGWLLRNSCSDARLRYREEFPPDEAKLGAKSAIALFRASCRTRCISSCGANEPRAYRSTPGPRAPSWCSNCRTMAIWRLVRTTGKLRNSNR